MITSKKPYLLRAMYDWLVDNEQTVHVAIDTKVGGCNVPPEYVRDDGQVVLNISPNAVDKFYVANDAMTFVATFAGQNYVLYLPLGAITAIYSKENGQGMMFDAEKAEPGKPALQLVVDNDAD